jgi:hypothetical protein
MQEITCIVVPYPLASEIADGNLIGRVDLVPYCVVMVSLTSCIIHGDDSIDAWCLKVLHREGEAALNPDTAPKCDVATY